ncbi:translation initiation factor eif-2b subunit gamma [Diplodia corticola]|uniref:Mannose-1-phosphate guanyltransferase n=1 Tax=Diplodia corticola TaxID=236234 RepID=A0A1J9QQX9_9PEZI|nr:translation initiation factor eif-2b subunit gamma [Diplodia corticola]OJD30856.1 translation initiation factor eif-2b subunit gamma [Diplodia corticola]
MPHANMPAPGFQALILCGPGVSLDTFTSSPKDFPKALVPIANRPMVWYPLEWCYRMGITNITLVTPPESAEALEAALSQNPHLTSLPSPKPDILAPEDLTQTTGTGELFRIKEVQDIIEGDFIVLPCDLVCELDGASLLESWMIEQGGLGGATGGKGTNNFIPMSTGGEKSGRRGGMGVWYQTKGEHAVKGEETDFIATTPLPKSVVPPHSGSLRPSLANLVYSIPTDVLNDITETKNFPIRHTLLKKHGRVRMLTTTRDSHVYFFPYWVLEMIKKNEKFDSLSDALGWWAKAGWQSGLGEKLGLGEILRPSESEDGDDIMAATSILQDDIDIASLSSTFQHKINSGEPQPIFASRVVDPDSPSLQVTPPDVESHLEVPPIIAYVQPTEVSAPFIRRVDTAALLLNVSLRLAKLPSIEEAGKGAASPFAHPAKIAHPDSVPKRCRVEAENSLIAENVIIEEKCNIKESVIGANCKIGTGARLQRCLLMDGAEVGENCQLTGCILGRRCKIEGGPAKSEEKTILKDCEVQESHVVEWGKEWKDEKFKRFGGDLDEDEGDDAFGGDDGTDDMMA